MIYLRVRYPKPSDDPAAPREWDATVYIPLPSWKAGWPDSLRSYLEQKCETLNTSGLALYLVTDTP